MNPGVDHYLSHGCGRCSLYDTPSCKVHKWKHELELFRSILAETELKEEIKWSMPCYTYNGKNILIMSAFKEYCSLNFFKGSLIKTHASLLTSAGGESNVSLLFKVTDSEQIEQHVEELKEIIKEAIANEVAGLKVKSKPVEEYEVPSELQAFFEQDSSFKSAFESLTPGRRKAYLLFFAQAKQSQTRITRIEKFWDKIMEGKGMMD